jgi:FdhD protein
MDVPSKLTSRREAGGTVGRVTSRRRVVRIDGANRTIRPDTLAVEEPLEIRVGGDSLSVTMRTPGDDFDLVAGFLVSEGVVRLPGDIRTMRYCAGSTDDDGNTYNLIDVDLDEGVAPPGPSTRRTSYTTSACGVCGKASIDAVRTDAPWPPPDGGEAVAVEVLAELPDRLRQGQRVFDRTGGLHAAGLFTLDGRPLCVREDVGRHNAVDKVVGWALREGRLPLRESVLQVSGRASFELTQKAMMAGIPVLAAVSAPSSLAVDLAEEAGMTLVGFVRGGSMNVYAGEHRVK